MTPARLYQGYVFDLDGTVYIGGTLLPGVRETITRLRQLGRRTVFISNNTTSTRAGYAEKLTRLGVHARVEDIVTPALVMVEFLKQRLPGARLFVVGEGPLMSDLREAGFELVDDASNIDAVIASFDRSFVYRKLQIAFDAIRGGARFFATHADPFCPVPGGGEPDAGAVIAAIEACTGTRCEAVIGKPSRHIIDALLGLLKLPAGECVITGDRLETDIRMGLDAGMAAALALGGATTADMLARSEIRPTYVLRQLGDLLPQE